MQNKFKVQRSKLTEQLHYISSTEGAGVTKKACRRHITDLTDGPPAYLLEGTKGDICSHLYQKSNSLDLQGFFQHARLCSNATLGRVVERFSLIIFVVSFFIILFSASTSIAEDIGSRAAVAIDSSTGKILYAKNPELRCLPASTTKLMTAIVTIEQKDLKDIVTISRNVSLTPPHKAGFKEGDKVSIEKLLSAALIGSANDAAVALAEAVAGSEAKFVDLMNSKAILIGASNTKFINANGLPGPGQYTTASDLSKIMNYALRYPKLKEIIGTRVTEISTERGKSIYLRNTNRLLWSDEELVGGKTGFTQKARHCFVCAAERGNDTVIVAILGSPSRSDLWRESEKLIDTGFGVIANKQSPMIYLAKATDVTELDNEAPVKRSKIHKKKSRAKTSKTLTAKKTGKHGITKVLAKKKGKAKVFAKNRTKKNYRIAKRVSGERNKG